MWRERLLIVSARAAPRRAAQDELSGPSSIVERSLRSILPAVVSLTREPEGAVPTCKPPGSIRPAVVYAGAGRRRERSASTSSPLCGGTEPPPVWRHRGRAEDPRGHRGRSRLARKCRASTARGMHGLSSGNSPARFFFLFHSEQRTTPPPAPAPLPLPSPSPPLPPLPSLGRVLAPGSSLCATTTGSRAARATRSSARSPSSGSGSTTRPTRVCVVRPSHLRASRDETRRGGSSRYRRA